MTGANPNQTRSRTILHVDDDPAILRIVAAKLRARGYDVISLERPTHALQTLLDTGARVVLLDIDMPEIDGLELLRKIKQQDGGVQAVMLTGVVSMATVLRAMRWGAEACLFKPLSNYETLYDAMDATFAKIDAWWKSLDELNQRRRGEQTRATAPVQ